MGWLWSDSKPTLSSGTGGAPKDHDRVTAPTAPESMPTALPEPKPRQLTRDEQADAELQALLKDLNYAPSDYPPSSIPTLSRKPSSDAAPPSSTTSARPPLSAEERSALAASPISPLRLLPTEMSCRAAFDQAYHCQLPGGQFGHVYRYGVLRNCSELWSNFWFCMRTNRGYMSDEQRAQYIRHHYWERQAKYRTGSSSEDVWRVRADVEDQPFSGDFEEVRDMLRQQQSEEQNRSKAAAEHGTEA